MDSRPSHSASPSLSSYSTNMATNSNGAAGSSAGAGASASRFAPDGFQHQPMQAGGAAGAAGGGGSKKPCSSMHVSTSFDDLNSTLDAGEVVGSAAADSESINRSESAEPTAPAGNDVPGGVAAAASGGGFMAYSPEKNNSGAANRPSASAPTASASMSYSGSIPLLLSGGSVASTMANMKASSTCGPSNPPTSSGGTPTGTHADVKAEGTVKLVIPSLSSLRHKVTTSFHTIANLPWRLAAKTESSKRTNNTKFFSVYIDCNPESESTLWSCEAIVEFRLYSQLDGVDHFSRHFTNKFNFNSNNWGFPSFMEWSEILDGNRGFIKNDRVIVEAHIHVQKTRGVRLSPVFDFTQPIASLSDGIIVIDGVRLHVSKAYLSLYSPVFSAMFFSEFKEKQLREVPIEEVLEEFIEMLHVIYPSHKPVTAENVEFLLELGDKFEVQYLMDECESFLTRSDDIPLVTKLVWADQYAFAKLQDFCVRTFKSITDIKALRSTEEYKNLSDATKSALLEKMFKLM